MANKVHTFPKIMQQHVKCPVCRQGCTGMVVVERGLAKRKYMLPCQHYISPVLEEIVVRDMLKRGL